MATPPTRNGRPTIDDILRDDERPGPRPLEAPAQEAPPLEVGPEVALRPDTEARARGFIVGCIRNARALEQRLGNARVIGASVAPPPQPAELLQQIAHDHAIGLAIILDLLLEMRTGRPELRPVGEAPSDAAKPN